MAWCAQCGRESVEDARFCPGCGASFETVALERRKLATMLFCDVSGSTGLGERVDAESVREIMLRYFREMRLTVFAKRGYHATVDIHRMEVPVRVNPETWEILCRTKKVYRIEIRYQPSDIQRPH